MYFRKNGNVHKMKKEGTCKNNMISSKNETVVLRMIYKSTLKCSNDSSRLWWNWQFRERSENWSHPIPSIGLGRQTTTTTGDENTSATKRDHLTVNGKKVVTYTMTRSGRQDYYI